MAEQSACGEIGASCLHVAILYRREHGFAAVGTRGAISGAPVRCA